MALFTFMDLLLYMVIFSLTASHVEGHSRPTSSPRMAGQSTSYRSFMPASNTPTCEFKILMTLRTCCTPSDLSYRVYVVLFCVILLTLRGTAGHHAGVGRLQFYGISVRRPASGGPSSVSLFPTLPFLSFDYRL